MRIPYWRVEPDWEGETCAILGGGPSLAPGDVNSLHGRMRVIAVNTAYQLAPWADLLYFSDEVWWCWHHGGKDNKDVHHKGDPRYHAFPGIKAALQNAVTYHREPAVRVLQNYGAEPGLCEIRDGVYTGRSSGYQAINLAAHLGVARILLLGFDMRAVAGRTHWHMAHKRPTAPEDFTNVMLPWFRTLVEPLAARGIEVLNATPGSAIDCFPRVTLDEALGAKLPIG